MIKIKAKDLRQMKDSELDGKLRELKKELLKINAQISTRTPPESPGKVKQIKKTVARILTILTEKKKQVKAAEVKKVKEVRSKK